jgi:DNA (cytosine-5)-methyltransferase 1
MRTIGAYYNEIDPYAAQWLRNLIKAGHIADGEVDTRSIVDVSPDELRGFTQCHFFAGIGGWSHALRLAGWSDTRSIWTGSCPCQPFSVAGKGAGQADERHLWPHFRSLIKSVQPSVVMGEQVAGTAGREWFDTVSNDLETDHYAIRAVDIPAFAVGAKHLRSRLYWIATNTQRDKQSWDKSCGREDGRMGRVQQSFPWDIDWESALSKFRALDDGVPRRVGATDAARNAIVPPLAAEVIKAFMEIEGGIS